MRTATLLLTSLLALLAGTTAQAAAPIKLWLAATPEPAVSGLPLNVRVELRDSDNRAVAAPRALALSLSLSSESGDTEARELTLDSGQSHLEFEWAPPSAGLAELLISHPELRPYSLLLPVLDGARIQRGDISSALLTQLLAAGISPDDLFAATAAGPTETTAASEVASPQVEQSTTSTSSAQFPVQTNSTTNLNSGNLSIPGTAKTNTAKIGGGLNNSTSSANVGTVTLGNNAQATTTGKVDSANTPVPAPMPEAVVVAPAAAAAPVPPRAAQITLRATPRRGVLADGRDAATVLAYLSGGVASERDIHVQLHHDAGTLSPTELVIAEGTLSARAKLTAERSGAVTVELLGAQPTTEVAVNFQPPITQLQLALSPPRISLIEPAEIVVTLLDAEGRPLATAQPRQISLTLAAGRGQLDHSLLEIPPGASEVRAQFQPTQPGEVRFAAASPQLLSVAAGLAVGWPWLALAVSMGSGASGGLLAWQNRRHQQDQADPAPQLWTRVVAGAFTGTLLYFAVLIGGGELVPAELRLNLATAFVAAAVGGWLGPRVFDLIIKRPGK